MILLITAPPHFHRVAQYGISTVQVYYPDAYTLNMLQRLVNLLGKVSKSVGTNRFNDRFFLVG